MSNSALNPNVVHTLLDKYFMQEFNGEQHPGYVTVESPLVYNQETSGMSSEVHEVNEPVGLWDSKGETENAQADTFRSKNQVTYTHTTFAKTLDLPKEYFDDNMHGQLRKNINEFARKGRQTKEKNGMATYRNAFSASFLGADGVSLVNPSHPVKSGATVSNEVASNPVLSETSLNTAIVQMVETKDQANVIGGNMPKVLFVPPALYKAAAEILESDQRSATSDNDMNVYSSKYGIFLATNPWIGAAGGGSDTAWYLISDNHGLFRYVRESLNTAMIDWRQTRNHNYAYTGRFRESTGFDDYAGLIGSDGTAA